MNSVLRRALIGTLVVVTGSWLIISGGLGEHRDENYSQIERGLFMGASVDRPPPGTRAVLNLCELEDDYRVDVQRWRPISDAAPAPSIKWLREQVDFVDANRRAGRTVFVHCRAGISRSSLVIAAYLMQTRRLSRDDALEFMRARRPEVWPNPAFMELLGEWEKSLSTRGK